MPTQEETLKERFDGLQESFLDTVREKTPRFQAKIINDWKENESISFGAYVDFTRWDCKNELSITFTFLFWMGWVSFNFKRRK